MEEGIIYIMTTVMPDIIKIGRTEEKQYKERMRNLEENGHRQLNGLKRCFAIKVSNYKNIEKLLQDTFYQQRIGKTEYFCLDPELVMRLLTAFNGKIIYPADNDTKKEFKALTETNEKNNLFKFSKKGIKEGSIITFIKDKTITAKVVGDREVEYNGNVWKLSSLVRKLFEDRGEINKSGAYQGAAYFEYKGKKLKDWADKL